MARRHRKTASQSLNGNGNGNVNGHANGNGLVAKEQQPQNGHIQKDAVGRVDVDEDELKKRVKKVDKIDWEIPRKVLHSSIGMLFFVLSVITVLVTHSKSKFLSCAMTYVCRILGHLLVHVAYVSTEGCACAVGYMCHYHLC